MHSPVRPSIYLLTALFAATLWLGTTPAPRALAATYYVRTDGNNGNSGTGPGTSQALRTIDYAVAQKVSGPGDIVYVKAGTYNEEVKGNASGSAGSPILVIADTAGSVSGWSPGTVTIQAISGKAAINTLNANYLHFVGFRVQGNGTNQAVTWDKSAGGRLRKCVILGGGHGILVNDSTTSLTVTNCLIRNNSGDGIHVNSGTLTVWNTTLVSNSDGVEMDAGTVNIRNSIIASNSGKGLDQNAGTMTHTYNLVNGNTIANFEGTSLSTGEITTAPQFYGSGDYHLKPISPAINTGTSAAGTVDDDLDTRPRPVGAAWDMGCYEGAETYYVRTDGSNSNTGKGSTTGLAWATVAYAATRPLFPGDIVYVRAGTYTGSVVVSPDGAAGRPIEFIADTNASVSGWPKGPVTLRVTSGVNVLDIDGDDYITFRGFTIEGHPGNDAIDIDVGQGVAIRQCEIYGGVHGVDIDQGASVSVINCLIRNNGGKGIRNLNGTATVWNCTIANNASDGVEHNAGTSTVRNCIIYNNGDAGFDLNGGTLTHTYNLVYANAGPNFEGTSASTGEITVDPKFLGDSSYHLETDSPAVNAGTNAAGTVDEDLIGAARPVATLWDLGCYELNMAGHWWMTEGTGTTAADSSPAANNATLSLATWTSDCHGAAALEFDGAGGIAQTNANLTPPSIGSVAFWMRGSGPTTYRQRLFGVNGDWEARLEPTGKISFDLGASPFVGNEPFATTSTVDGKDRWYHIVATFDATTDAYQVYVDGELQASGTSPVNLVAQSANKLSFGTRTGSNEYWKGALRDFRIYRRLLRSDEVVKLAKMVGHWRLDETTGTVAADSAGGKIDGTYLSTPTLGVNSRYAPTNGTAVQFDGSAEHVVIPHTKAMLADQGTVAFWFRNSNLTATQGLFSKDAGGYGTGGHLNIQLVAGKVQVRLQSTSQSYTIESAPVGFGKWTHVGFTWGPGGMILYVDGYAVASDLYTGGLGTSSGGTGNQEPIVLAASTVVSASLASTPLQDFLDGALDEVFFYGRALCPEELYQLYRGGWSPGVRIMSWVEVR
jgi:hypothetical protein